MKVKRLIVLVFACLMGMQSVLSYAFTNATQGGNGQQSEASTMPPCHMAVLAIAAEDTVNSPQQCCADGSLCQIVCGSLNVANLATPNNYVLALDYLKQSTAQIQYKNIGFISFVPETAIRPPIHSS